MYSPKYVLAIVLMLVLLLSSACAPPQQTPIPTSAPAPAETPFDQALPLQQSGDDVSSSHSISPLGTPMPTVGMGNADVEFVKAVWEGEELWTFHVTVLHPDRGWEDYADGWDVVLPDGSAVLHEDESPFTRLLLHPHENEQPFTRSQSGIRIPENVNTVAVRAHDLVDGWGGKVVKVHLSQESGEGFEVVR